MKVMAMYDVRGIQKYIFRTPKIKDAIGASDLVDGIIEEALKYAVNQLGIADDADLTWYTEDGFLPYHNNDKKVCVLYIGGGNAYILCESRELCLKINRIMAKFTIEKTYSLQLATAMVDVSGDYHKDYKNLMDAMNKVKAEMVVSKPLGALPIMEVEVKTGYPSSAKPEAGRLRDASEKISTESLLKLEREQKVRAAVDEQMKILDNYTLQKGVDSTIAVVHIDGNNMGLRIRGLIEKLHDYEEAVNMMRRISYNINTSYRKVFDSMQKLFNEKSGAQKGLEQKKTNDFVLKILTAGDDITYVCNGKIAIATVEYFCREISGYTMTGDTDEKSVRNYGFSVCGGIAYIGSHFPFYAGYDVAESCCDNAKDYAKNPKYQRDYGIGNWLDFQICKNIQAQNLKAMRKREYVTGSGENLIGRPYFVSTPRDQDVSDIPAEHQLNTLKSNILYFQNEKNIPRSFAKNLRNIYSEGEKRARQFMAFMESRSWKMPDGGYELYIESTDKETGRVRRVAKWYDAVEMMDDYIDLENIITGVADAKGGKA